MGTVINLRTLSKEKLNKKVSELFPLHKNEFKFDKDEAIRNKNFIIKNKDSYLKIIVDDNVSGKIVYVGKFDTSSNESFPDTFIANGNGYTFNNHKCYPSKLMCFNYENAKISILSEEEYKKIVNKYDSLLSSATTLYKKLLDSYKNNSHNKILGSNYVKRPVIDKFFKIEITTNFVKQNQNKTFLEVYKKALSKYQKKCKEYKAKYEKTKELIGKYFIYKNGAGKITQVENEDYIKTICSYFYIFDTVLTLEDKHEIWFDAYEITADDYNSLISIINQIKQLYDDLKKC